MSTFRATCPRPLVLGLVLASVGAPLWAGEPPVDSSYAHAFHRGEYSEAIALATEEIERHPSDVAARIVRARAQAALGRFDAAFVGFRESLELAPGDPDALYYLGITAGVLAQVEYDRLVSEAPDSARAHQLLGQSYEAQGKTPEAEAEYRAALERDPGLVEALVALGDLARGDLARSRERLSEARAYYERALQVDPRSYGALYGLGACRAFAAEHAEAAQSFRRALEVAPDSAPAHLGLGIALLEAGEVEAAVTTLEAAVELEARMREAWYQLGRAYQSLGRSDAARDAFARVQQLMREEREAREAMVTAPEEP